MNETNVIDIVATSLYELWFGLINILGLVIAALIIFLIGLIAASILGSVVERLVRALKVDAILKKAGVEQYFERAGLNLDSGKFFGKFTFWFFVIASLLAVSGILGFSALTAFLHEILLYIPNVLVAALILLATFAVAHFLKGVVSSSVKSANLHSYKFLSSLVWWVIVVFGFLAAISQLGIAQDLINTLVLGLVGMFAIAGGIAFGLGGKNHAEKLLERIQGMHK